MAAHTWSLKHWLLARGLTIEAYTDQQVQLFSYVALLIAATIWLVHRCPVTTKIPRPMPLACEEESMLTTRDENTARFVGFHGGQAVARDDEDCSARSVVKASCTLPACINATADGCPASNEESWVASGTC